MEIVITDPGELPKILDKVHDKWFDLDKLKTVMARGIVNIPVARKQGDLSENSGHKALLSIHNVTKLEIDDPERVGFYDINEIDFDRVSGCIKITGGIPSEIRIFVEKFHMSFDSGFA
ncbi:MAG TPA: hypothetical protein DCP85_09060 [Elusimicrobia bacterium]|nr:hypothetical protein [Elusimicrobiota bacterium]